jgi:cytochrome b561
MSLSYRASQKAVHWIAAGLVFFLYAITYAGDFFPRGSPERATGWWLHISFGLTLVIVVVVRLLLRGRYGAPVLPGSMTTLEKGLAHLGHAGLYLLLTVVPILGVALTWLRGDTLSLFGLLTIPSPVAADKNLAHIVQETHNLCATALVILAGLHGLVALFHHFVRRDDVLRRMLPGRI